MKDLLTGRVILISGGTQGLGAAVARAGVREGAAVVITHRLTDRGSRRVGATAAAPRFSMNARQSAPRSSTGWCSASRDGTGLASVTTDDPT